MDAQQFLAEFRHIANAPGGIGKLRELVIQLAISGRLVEPVKSEGAVSQVIEESANLRSAYAMELELRATRLALPLNSRPFPVPDHWQWIRLEQLCLYIQRGKGPKYAESGSTQVISQKCIQWSGFDLSSARFVDDESMGSYGKERFLCKGDLLWNSTGTGTVGRVAIYPGEEGVKAVADSHVTVVRLANCSPRYLWCVIASPWVQSRIEPSHPDSLVSGTTQQVELNNSTARALPIPLPPLEEQSRIVAKVDELMALCDKLEVQQQACHKLQNKLRQSTLQAIASAPNPHELQTTWTRLADNFGWLFHAPEDLIDLSQCIKQLALKGLLSVRVEGEMVNSEIEELTRTSTASVPNTEMDWLIPDHWVWARCAWLGEARLGKMLDAAKNKGDFRPYLRNINVRWGRFDLSDVLQMRVEEHELSKVSVRKGDLVICEGGEPGRAAVWTGKEEFVIQKALHRFRCNAHVLPEYILFCLEHDYFSGRLSRYFTGATIKHLTGRALAEYSIPLPPVDEQKRILVSANELMHSVATLKERLQAGNRCAAALAAASVANLTGIAIEQKEEPMKAPQTELVAPLRLGTAPDIKDQAPLATMLARHHGEMSAKDMWQRFGGEIDAFYAQLKTEVAHGWILEPTPAEMREKPADTVSA